MVANPPSGPLVGVRVLDFSSFIAGPFAAMMLGDLGAEVVKVESLAGDLGRHWGPWIRGESRLFQGWNRNKRSISLDMRSPEGLEIVYRLVDDADVVIENFRPGVTDKLSIDEPTLRERNPRLIYASASAFGTRGPYSERPGYDPVLQSMGGSAIGQLRYSGVVSISSVAVADFQAAMLLTSGVTSALYHREKTGVGQKVETSLLQAILSVQSHSYAQPLEAKEEGPAGIYPYRLYETAEGKLFVAAGTDKFWRLLCEALGVPELGTDPRHDTNRKRVATHEELTARLQPIFVERSALDWEALLVEKGVPCAAVRTHAEFFVDPQVEAMGMNPVIEHSVCGPLRLAGVPFDLSQTPGAIQRHAPVLGEHTEEVLGELGYEPERVAELITAGIVKPARRSSAS